MHVKFWIYYSTRHLCTFKLTFSFRKWYDISLLSPCDIIYLEKNVMFLHHKTMAPIWLTHATWHCFGTTSLKHAFWLNDFTGLNGFTSKIQRTASNDEYWCNCFGNKNHSNFRTTKSTLFLMDGNAKAVYAHYIRKVILLNFYQNLAFYHFDKFKWI